MFCFSVSFKNGFSFLCNSPFLILRFKSVSLFYCPFLCIQKLKKNVFDGNDGKTIFCILSLFSCFFFEKTMCVRKNPLFFIIFETQSAEK